MPMNEADKIVHLLRRADFAARPEEIERGVARGLEVTVNDLVDFETTPDNLAPAPPVLDLDEVSFSYSGRLILWWLNAMITTTRPLQEKMALFWHGLFATSGRGVGDMRQLYLQNENFRGNFDPDTGQIVSPNPASPFPVGNFRDMLEYVSKDPAMLYWLDNRLNRKLNTEVGSNENYARELLELFSMGVQDVVATMPNYTERDVRQASRALTGWSVHQPGPEDTDKFPRRFVFNYQDHDPGPYTVLGVTFRGHGRRLFDIIVQYKNPEQQQSAVGRFLGYRLFKFFGYDDPEPEIINALAAVFDGANGERPYMVRNMLRAMFTPGNLVSEAFYSDQAFRAHVKSPTEYVVSMFRLLKPTGIGEELINDIKVATTQMGQCLFFPPDVSGWKEGLNWINTTFALARYNFAHDFITQPSVRTRVDVESHIRQNNLKTPEEVVDYFTRLLLHIELPSQMRATLIQYLLSNTSGPFNLSDRRIIDNKVRGLIYLIMATPEFQLS